MNWSNPKIERQPLTARYRGWVFVLIITLVVVLTTLFIVLTTPLDLLHKQPVSDYTEIILNAGMILFILLAAYAIPVEHKKLKTIIWNRWRARDLSTWQAWVQEHYQLRDCAVLSSFSPISEDITQMFQVDPLSLKAPLFADLFVSPGIIRFEQMCRTLLAKISPSLKNLPKQAKLIVLLQPTEWLGNVEPERLSSDDSEQHTRIKTLFERLWRQAGFVHPITVELCQTLMIDELEQRFDGARNQHLLIICAQYQTAVTQGADEFASVLLLEPGQQQNEPDAPPATLFYRSISSTTENLQRDITELILAGQQSTQAIKRIWFSGLDKDAANTLNVIASELGIELDTSEPPFGLMAMEPFLCQNRFMAQPFLLALSGCWLKQRNESALVITASDDNACCIQLIGNQPAEKPSLYEDSIASPFPTGTLCGVFAISLALITLCSLLFPAMPGWLWLGVFSILVILLSMILIPLHWVICAGAISKEYHAVFKKN